MRSANSPARGAAVILATLLLLVSPTSRSADGGTGDSGASDAAADGGGDGGTYTMSGHAESGCTCAAPGAGWQSGASRWSIPLRLVVELISPRE